MTGTVFLPSAFAGNLRAFLVHAARYRCECPSSGPISDCTLVVMGLQSKQETIHCYCYEFFVSAPALFGRTKAEHSSQPRTGTASIETTGKEIWARGMSWPKVCFCAPENRRSQAKQTRAVHDDRFRSHSIVNYCVVLEHEKLFWFHRFCYRGGRIANGCFQ